MNYGFSFEKASSVIAGNRMSTGKDITTSLANGIISEFWTNMEEIADTITFLASDRAHYYNGVAIIINGGMDLTRVDHAEEQ